MVPTTLFAVRRYCFFKASEFPRNDGLALGISDGASDGARLGKSDCSLISGGVNEVGAGAGASGAGTRIGKIESSSGVSLLNPQSMPLAGSQCRNRSVGTQQ